MQLNLRLLSIVLVIAIIFIACEEEKKPPKIKVYPESDTSAYEGDIIDYTVLVTSDQKIDSIVVFTSMENAQEVESYKTYNSYSEEPIEFNYSYKVPAVDEYPKEITLKFKARDSESLIKKVLRSIIVFKTPVELKHYKDINLYIINNNNSKSFFNVLHGIVYSADEVNSVDSLKEQVDFGYYYNETNGHTIAAIRSIPDTFINLAGGVDSWVKKITKFKKLSNNSLFDDINYDVEIDTLNIALTDNATTNLNEDDIVGFETEEGNIGLIKVTQVVGEGKPGDYITIEVKVKE